MREVCEPVSSKGGSSFTYFQSGQQLLTSATSSPHSRFGVTAASALSLFKASYGPLSKTFLITLGFAVPESPQHVAFEPYPLA